MAKRFVTKHRAEWGAIGWSILDKETGQWVLIPGTPQAANHPCAAVAEMANQDSFTTPWRYVAQGHADKLNRTQA
jgi:hypothetical protein